MGLVDVGFIAGRRKPFLVGVIGPHNAGKTTMLASWYLLLSRGVTPLKGRSFAGTYTFDGWESLANAMRWAPGAKPIFPAHTTSRESRSPGLLHLCFRDQENTRVDFLLADAPGEWFQKWAMNANAVEAEGARWVSSHADLFLLIADCDALSGPAMGTARGAFQFQTRRLANDRGERPVALVWTKSDIRVGDEMAASVRKIAHEHISPVKLSGTFRTTKVCISIERAISAFKASLIGSALKTGIPVTPWANEISLPLRTWFHCGKAIR